MKQKNNQNKLDKYLDVTGWKDLVKNRHIILDTDFIIKTIEYGAEDVFDEFEKQNARYCIIQPVELELLNVKENKVRAARSALLKIKNFLHITLHPVMFKNIKEIQRINAELGTYSSVTDMYLASCMDHFNNGQTLLLTGNAQDYPSPLFIREGYLILQDSKKIRTFCFLKINKDLLK